MSGPCSSQTRCVFIARCTKAEFRAHQMSHRDSSETRRVWLLVLVTDVFLMRLSPRVPLADLDGERHIEMPDILHRFDDPRTHFFHRVFGDLEE